MTEAPPPIQSGATAVPNGLGLQVPLQSPPPVGSFLVDPKQTAQWFDTLPMANIGEAARHVFKALVDMNRMTLPDKVRIRNSERFRQPVGYITSNLSKHYLDKGFPLADKNLKVSALARELHSELAISYKIIVENMLSSKREHVDRDLLAISLHRALFHIGQMMYESGLVYCPAPTAAWQEANAMFAYALENDIQDLAIKDSKEDNSAGVTIARVYKGMVLLATASPARLRQAQIQQLAKRTDEWSRHVRVLKNVEGAVENAIFTLDPSRDNPPMHHSLVQEESGGELFFDMAPLLIQLREELEKLPWEGGSDLEYSRGTIPRGLLRLLMLGWSTSPARKFVRTRLNFELHVAVGIGVVHDLIQGISSTPAAPKEKEVLPEQTSVDYNKDLWGDSGGSFSLAPLDSNFQPDDISGEPAHDSGASSNRSGIPAWASPESELEQEVVHVQTSNESAGGYCICWQKDSVPKVRVGELIGIQSASNQHQFGVCAVRWLQAAPGQPLEMGLQIMAPRCHAGEVSLSSAGTLKPDAARVRCLLLMEPANGEKDSAAIIVQSTQYHEGNTLSLFIEGETRKIRLTRQIESGPNYVQYEFEEVSEKETGSGNVGPGDFDDIWSTL